ncbi:MAG TPA: hypothetical protein PK466_10920 [Thermotogota bacterium]|nr:hypothetical protein [Thermotogota bacterium]HPJ89658.1 hypothetical protein [Thermotogota bacterium]HPR96837.1 hypothetical protein [Thermotogota bacterium]
MKITKLPSIFENKRFFFLTFLILVSLYLFISYSMLENNVYPPDSLQFGANELLNRANNLSFINDGNYNIPLFDALNYSLTPRWPSFIPIVFVTLIISYLILFIFNNFRSKTLKVLISLFIAFLPSTIFIVTDSPEMAILIVLFSLTMYFILEFTLNERVFFLFMAAITFGLLFYILFEIIWFVIFFAVYFSIVYAKRKKHINFIITITFPSLFFLVSWIFLMWIFKADIESFFRENLLLNFTDGIQGFHKYLQQNIYARWPVLVLYLYILFTLGKFKLFFTSPLFMAFIAPVILALILNLGGFPVNSSFYISISMINIIILFPYLGPLFNERRQKRIILFFLVFIFAFDVYSAMYTRQGQEKLFFSAVLNTYESEEVIEYKEVAKQMKGYQNILTDWEETYGIIYFHEDARLFLTSKTPNFINISLNPQLYADAILFYKFGETYRLYDQHILREYFESTPAYESENYLLFSRKKEN